MAPRVLWRELALVVPLEEGEQLLENGKMHAAGKSQAVTCTMCATVVPHPMRYKLMSCRSATCKTSYPGIECKWKGKVTTCTKENVMSKYQAGEHLCLANDSPQRALSEPHKQYCRLMAAEGMKPLRIRNGLRIKFELSSAQIPQLSTVQNFVNNYRKTKLGNHDRVQDIQAMVRARGSSEDDNGPLTFTSQSDENGNGLVGNGTGASPFIVGVTTRNLPRRLERPPVSFVLHVDATYKLSQVGYPVLVGISDRCRTFHLVAFCILSQTTEGVYAAALASLSRVYTTVTGRAIQLTYVMGDADDAQYNALHTVFGSTSSFNFLMCFFHVLLNVNKKLQAVPHDTAASIRKDIYDMHFCVDKDEFLRVASGVAKRWNELVDAPAFAGYFSKQWFSKRFLMWQCFWTPPGFATTNNPVEQFNRHIKQHYSLHLKLKTGTLLHLLCQCAASESVAARPFRESVEAPSTFATRMRELARAKLLLESQTFSYSKGGVVAIQAFPAKRVYVFCINTL